MQTIIDPNNPVVKLCIAGMAAEAEGRMSDAAAFFLQAWAARQDDLDACVAAHYVARHQASPAEMLRWNQLALDHARAIDDERVQGFYPSLYLNLGWSHEALGDRAAAHSYYDSASATMAAVPDGPYRNKVQRGIAAARNRTA
jgi:hypothetical protein